MSLIKNITTRLDENQVLKKKIQLEAERETAQQLDMKYRDKLHVLEQNHKAENDRREAETEERLRKLKTRLFEEYKKQLDSVQKQHDQEKTFLKEEIASYKKEIKTINHLHNEEVFALKSLYKTEKETAETRALTELREQEEKMQKEIDRLKDEISDQKQKLTNGFATKIRELNDSIEEKTIKLRRAQVGFRKYLEYATNTLNLASELKAQFDMFRINTAQQSQKIMAIHDKFEDIERFNVKNKAKIEKLLGFKNISDDEIVAEVLLDYNSREEQQLANNEIIIPQIEKRD